jgi:hypothetical protein
LKNKYQNSKIPPFSSPLMSTDSLSPDKSTTTTITTSDPIDMSTLYHQNLSFNPNPSPSRSTNTNSSTTTTTSTSTTTSSSPKKSRIKTNNNSSSSSSSKSSIQKK